nr:MAG TPA: hypothetical protein [Caudoviricetes sp.]
MIKTDEFGRVTVNGMVDNLFAEYEIAGKALVRGALSAGCDELVLKAILELCFSKVMEVLEEEKK